jgi:hypothetical protein
MENLNLTIVGVVILSSVATWMFVYGILMLTQKPKKTLKERVDALHKDIDFEKDMLAALRKEIEAMEKKA